MQKSEFSDVHFDAIAQLAYREAGLALPMNKKAFVYSRLQKRVKELGLADVKSYCDMLQSPGAEAEHINLVSALTTNVTRFFREPHHFETMIKAVIPQLAQKAKAGEKIRIWSAGCSAGQEPYTIALLLQAFLPDIARADCRVLGTDIDPNVLRLASQGTYEVGPIPDIYRSLFDGHTLKTDGTNTFTFNTAVRNLVSFRRLNLMDQWPMKGAFDVIFCRNVAIYFDAQTQDRLFERLTDKLTPGGWLFVGHSERVNAPALTKLTPAGLTSYQRNSN